MKKRPFLSRGICAVLCAAIVFTTVPAEVYAEIGDTIGNSQEQNEQILDDLKEITGSEASAEQAMAQLQDMGLLDEEGNIVTSESILVDGSPMTLSEVKRMLADPGTDLGKEVTVDGQTLTLSSIKTMLEIEEELARIEAEYFSADGVEITEEHKEAYEDLMEYVKENGLPLENGEADQGLRIDHAGRIQVTKTEKLAEDGSGTVDFTFQLVDLNDQPLALSGYEVSADYETRDGSARAGEHYTAASGTVTLNEENSFCQTVTVNVSAHDTHSLEEGSSSQRWNGTQSFYLYVSNPQNAIFRGNLRAQLIGVSLSNNYSWAEIGDVSGGKGTSLGTAEGGASGAENRGRVSANTAFPGLTAQQKEAAAEGILTRLTSSTSTGAADMNLKYGMRVIMTSGGLKTLEDYKYGGLHREVSGTGFLKDVGQEDLNLSLDSGELLNAPELGTVTVAVWGDEPADPSYPLISDMYVNTCSVKLQMMAADSLSVVSCTAPAGEYMTGSSVPVTVEFSLPVNAADVRLHVVEAGGNRELNPVDTGISRRVTFLYEVPAEPGTELVIEGVTGGTSYYGVTQQDYSEQSLALEGIRMVRDDLRAFESITTDQETYKANDTVKLTLHIDKQYSKWLETTDQTMVLDDGATYLSKTYLQIDGDTYPLMMDPSTTGEEEGSRYLAEIPASEYAALEEAEKTVELYWGGTYVEASSSAGTLTPAHFEDGALVVGISASFTLEQMILVTGLELDETVYPDGGKLYKMSQTAARLKLKSVTLSNGEAGDPEEVLPQATFPEIQWVSGSTDTAIINADNGVITVKNEGEVAFRAVAENGGFTEPVYAETPVFTAGIGGPPNIIFQEGNDIFVADRNGETEVIWVESVTDVVPEAVFAVELYEGRLTLEELEGKEPILKDEVAGASQYTVKENILSLVSEDGVPSYTVRVSAPDPNKEGNTLQALGYIVVLPRPASVRFDSLESYYILDSAGSVGLQWQISDYSGGEFSFTVLKNGEPFDEQGTSAVTAQPDSTEPGRYELSLDPVPEGTLKDIYTVTARVKNGEEAAYSEDSFFLHVYDADAMKILIDGEEPVLDEEGRLVMDNNAAIRSLYEEGGSEAILALQRNIQLKHMISINYADYPWGAVTDQIQWDDGSSELPEGSRKPAAVNYPASIYSDIEDMDYSSYGPSTGFMLTGLWDGETTITATHARTGQEKTLDVKVDTLRDKLYLFQFTPAQTTEIHYTNGEGEEVTLTSNENGELAVYDETGIASDVTLKSGSEEEPYLGTIYQEDLVSMEGNAAYNELYPVNRFRLRRVAHLELYLKDKDGKPYTGEITYRGAVYKNGELCADTMNGATAEAGGALYGDPDARTIALGEDGRFTLEFDATQFWTQTHGEALEATDRIKFVYEVRFPEDNWYPQLITVDASINADDRVDFGENIVTVEPCEEKNKEQPFISAYYVDYGLTSERLLDVTYHIGSVGASNAYPDAKLRVLSLLWGCGLEEEEWSDYEMEVTGAKDHRVLARQSQKAAVYPFSTIPYLESVVSMTPESTGLEKGEQMKGEVKLKNSSGSSVVETTAFSFINMVGVTDVQQSYTIEEKLQALQDSSKQTTSMDGIFEQGGFLQALAGIAVENNGISLMDNNVFQLKLAATEDPTVYRGMLFLNADFIGQKNRPMIDYPQDPATRWNYTPSAFDVLGLLSNPKKLLNKKEKMFQDAKDGKVTKDIGGQVSGYYECEVRFDMRTNNWQCVLLNGGFTVAANLDFAWYSNFMLGFVPVTMELGVGGILMLDFKSTLPVEEALVPQGKYREDLNDFLTTLRMWFYTRAFVGVGFDYSVIALKIGIYGQLDLDSYNYFLTRTYAAGQDLKAQRTTLHAELGLKFVAQLLFLNIESTFLSTDQISIDGASVGDGLTWKTGDAEAMENWMAKTDFPTAIPGYNSTGGAGNTPAPDNASALSAFSAKSAAASQGLVQADSGFHMEERDYLEKYPRYWGDSGISTMALDEESRLGNLEFNTYPYANPAAADDGSIVAYLSDSGSTDLNDTRASYAFRGADGSYADPQPFPAAEGEEPKEICAYCGLVIGLKDGSGCTCVCPVCGEYPDSCTCEHPYCGYCGLRRYTEEAYNELTEEEKAKACTCRCENCGSFYLDCECEPEKKSDGRADSSLTIGGTDSFAVAAWERQRYTLPESGATPSSQELDAMMNGTEIYASVYVDGAWTTTRLTDNGTPDLAPAVAVRGNRAVVAWRSTAGSDSQLGRDGMPEVNYDDRFDSLRCRIYENGQWSEIKTFYLGNLGNVKGLEMAMLSDGTAAAAYTVNTGEEDGTDGAGYEVLVSLLPAEGEERLIRLTSNGSLDENVKITAVTFPDGEERFVAAWYSAGTDEEGNSTGDISLASFGGDGVLDTDFVDSLSELSNTTGTAVTGNFRFAKGADVLSDLMLVWSEPVLAYDEENKAEAKADCLQAVKFGWDESGKRVYLTPAQEVAAMPHSTAIDYFDAYVSGSNAVSAFLLTSAYEGELEQVSGDVYVIDPIASMQTASAEFENSIHVEGITMDSEALAAGGRLTIGFTVSNRGFSPVESLDIQVGSDTAVSIPVDGFLPNSQITQTYTYHLPETLADAGYTITAHFADGSQSEATGTLNLDIPDAAISTLNMGDWGEGMRTFTALVANTSDVELNGASGRKVYLAVYNDSNCTEDSRVPFYVGEELIPEDKAYEITGDGEASQLAMMDNGSLVLKLGYDIRKDLEDGLFPKGGITLYVRTWVEETADGATYELAEFDENNNIKSILFTDPVQANDGETHEVRVDQKTQDGKTSAEITVKNLSMQPSENGNLAVSLLDERGEVIETRLYAVSAEDLIALGGEESLTFPVEFEQEGRSVTASYFTAVPDEWENKLAKLNVTGTVLNQQFEPAVADYSAQTVNLDSITVQAAAQSMNARVELQTSSVDGAGNRFWYTVAEGQGTAGAQVKLTSGMDGAAYTNEIRVVVTPANEDAQAMTYSLSVDASREQKGQILLNADQPLNEGWTNSETISVTAVMDGVDDFTSVKGSYRVNGGQWEEAESPVLDSQTVELAQDGKHQIEGRMTDADGYRRSAGTADIWIDRTAPVLDADSLIFLETDQPLEKDGRAAGLFTSIADFFRGLFGGDGMTDCQLQVEIRAADCGDDWESDPRIPTETASGISSVTIEAGDRSYPMELAVDSDGQYIWKGVVTHEYRGTLTVKAADTAGNEASVATKNVIVSDSNKAKLEVNISTGLNDFCVTGSLGVKPESDVTEYGAQYRLKGAPEWTEISPSADSRPNQFTFAVEGLNRSEDYEFRLYWKLITEDERTYGDILSIRTRTPVLITSKTPVAVSAQGCADCKATVSADAARPGDTVTFTLTGCRLHTPDHLEYNGMMIALKGEGAVRTAEYTLKESDTRLEAVAVFRDRQPAEPFTFASVTLKEGDARAESEESLLKFLNGRSYTVAYDNGYSEEASLSWKLSSTNESEYGVLRTYETEYQGQIYTVNVSVEKSELTRYWDRLVKAIEGAKAGQTIRSDVGDCGYVPARVLEALAQSENVTLILTRGGEALTLTSEFAAALTEERDYTWEELMALTAALENEAGGDKEDTAGTEITVAGPGEDDGSGTRLLIAAGCALAAVVFLLAVLMLRRRRRKENEDEAES